MSTDLSIACPKKVWPWFEEICMGMHHAAKDLGLKSEVTLVNTFDEYNRGEVNLFFGAHIFMEREGTQSVEFVKPEGAKWVWYQLEQIPHFDGTTNVTNWRWFQTEGLKDNFDWILVESPSKHRFLQNMGIKSDILLCGYHPQNESSIPEMEEEFDFLFLGAMTPRRGRIIERILNTTNLKMFPIRPFITGREKAIAMKKSKVYLNIHMNDLKAFEKPRIITDGLSNKRFVLSESIDHMEDFIDGEHFVTCAYDDLIDKIYYYVEHDKERKHISQAGYQFVKENYQIAPSLKKAIAKIKED